MIRSISYSRYFMIPTPMPAGRATTPTSSRFDTAVEPTTLPSGPTHKVTAAPQASHFSCWRRSPVARRQLSTWWPANDSQIAPMARYTMGVRRVTQPLSR